MEGNEAAAWARSKYRLTQQRKRGRGGRGGRGGGCSGAAGPAAALDQLDSNYDRYAEEEAEDAAAEDGAAPRLSEGADLEKLLADTESLHAKAWYRHRSHLSALAIEGAEALPAVDVAATEAALALDLEALAASLAALPAAELLGVPEEYLEGLQLEGLDHWRGWQKQQLQHDQQQQGQQQQQQQQQRVHAQSLPVSQQPKAPQHQQQQQQQRSSAALLPWERVLAAAPAAASVAVASATAPDAALKTHAVQLPVASTAPIVDASVSRTSSSRVAPQPAVHTPTSTPAAPAGSTAVARADAEDDFLDTLLSHTRAGCTKQAVAAGPSRPTPSTAATRLPPAQQRGGRPAAGFRDADDSLDALLGSSTTSSTTSAGHTLQPAAPRQATGTKLPDPGGKNSRPAQAKGAPKRSSLDDWLDSL